MHDGEFGDVYEMISVKQYICFFLINLVQPIGLIYDIVKMCGDNVSQSYKNLCKAYLVMILIGIGIVVVLSILMVVLFAGVFAALA